MERDDQFLAACKQAGASDWPIAVILTSHWLQGDFAQFHKLLQEGADVNHRHGEPLREAITNR